jgi:hypothetical protein
MKDGGRKSGNRKSTIAVRTRVYGWGSCGRCCECGDAQDGGIIGNPEAGGYPDSLPPGRGFLIVTMLTGVRRFMGRLWDASRAGVPGWQVWGPGFGGLDLMIFPPRRRGKTAVPASQAAIYRGFSILQTSHGTFRGCFGTLGGTFRGNVFLRPSGMANGKWRKSRGQGRDGGGAGGESSKRAKAAVKSARS